MKNKKLRNQIVSIILSMCCISTQVVFATEVNTAQSGVVCTDCDTIDFSDKIGDNSDTVDLISNDVLSYNDNEVSIKVNEKDKFKAAYYADENNNSENNKPNPYLYIESIADGSDAECIINPVSKDVLSGKVIVEYDMKLSNLEFYKKERSFSARMLKDNGENSGLGFSYITSAGYYSCNYFDAYSEISAVSQLEYDKWYNFYILIDTDTKKCTYIVSDIAKDRAIFKIENVTYAEENTITNIIPQLKMQVGNLVKGQRVSFDNYVLTKGESVENRLRNVPKVDFDFENMVENSTILAANKSFYIKNGTRFLFNNNTAPLFENGELYVSTDILKKMIDCKIDFNSSNEKFDIKYKDTELIIVSSEDRVEKDGVMEYMEHTVKKTGKQYLFPLQTICEKLKVGIVANDDIFILCDDKKYADALNYIDNEDEFTEYTLRCGDLFLDSVLSEGFESGSAWTFTDTATYRTGGARGNGITSKEKHSGSSSCYINSIPIGEAMYCSKIKPFNQETRAYKIIFWAKASEDFENLKVMARVGAVKNGNVRRYHQTLQTNSNTLSTQWQRFEFEIATRTIYENNSSGAYTFDRYKEKFFDSLQMCVGAAPVNSGTEGTGTVYIDDVEVFELPLSDEYAQVYAEADKFAAWYILGDEVKHNFLNTKQLDGAVSLTANYYDIDNVLADSVTTSVEKIKNSGYILYKPQNIGYYELELYLNYPDGTSRLCSDGFSFRKSTSIYTIPVTRHKFVVVPHESKPMEERNDCFMLSDDAGDMDMLKLADMVGYSGVRIHYINWGDNYSSKGFNSAKDVYDWESADLAINNANEIGFKTIIPNIFSTPRWAVPEKYYSNTSMTIGNYGYNRVAPSKKEYIYDAMVEFTKRYKDKIDGIEFWNEPYYGSTAFWIDGIDNFRTMSNTAYDAVKSVDENMPFISAGFFRAANGFVKELLTEGEYKFDEFSYHGSYFSYRDFKDIVEEYMTDVPIWDSEGYFYAQNKENGDRDIESGNMMYVLSILSELKNNHKYTTYFSLTNLQNYDQQNYLHAGYNEYGIFDLYPYVEPLKGSIVAYTLMDLVGLDFKYECEYNLADGQKAIKFSNDGKPFVILWNSNGEKFKLDERMAAVFNDKTQIIDFEGKKADINNLKPMKIYYITDASEDVLNGIESEADTALCLDYERPFWNCKLPEAETSENIDWSEIIYNNNAKEKPFDAATFKTNDNVVWNTEDWKWVSSSGPKPDGYSAKHCMYIDKDGLYVMIDVNDKIFYNTIEPKTNAGNQWEYDSIQIGIDTTGGGAADERIELQISQTPSGVCVYKGFAPDPGAMLPSDYTKVNNNMPSNYASVEQTETGTIYKVFIPTSEMFPYTFEGNNNGYTRVSLLVNNNNGNGRIGYLEWGSGIGGNKDPKLYGAIIH